MIGAVTGVLILLLGVAYLTVATVRDAQAWLAARALRKRIRVQERPAVEVLPYAEFFPLVRRLEAIPCSSPVIDTLKALEADGRAVLTDASVYYRRPCALKRPASWPCCRWVCCHLCDSVGPPDPARQTLDAEQLDRMAVDQMRAAVAKGRLVSIGPWVATINGVPISWGDR